MKTINCKELQTRLKHWLDCYKRYQMKGSQSTRIKMDPKLKINRRKTKMIKITEKRLVEMQACSDGIRWFVSHKVSLLTDLVLALVVDNHADYARWLLSHLMTHSQRIMWAVFSAEQAIESFEKVYPDDMRPRKAIQAAKDFLAGKIDASAAYSAAYSATSATYSAAYSAASATYSAASAAYSAAYSATSATYSAASAAYSATSAAYSAAYSATSATYSAA